MGKKKNKKPAQAQTEQKQAEQPKPEPTASPEPPTSQPERPEEAKQPAEPVVDKRLQHMLNMFQKKQAKQTPVNATAVYVIKAALNQIFGANQFSIVSTDFSTPTKGELVIADYPADKLTDSSQSELELACNTIIQQSLPISLSSLPLQEFSAKVNSQFMIVQSDPPLTDPVAIVTIGDDVCMHSSPGYSFLNSTGELGQINIVKLKSKGKSKQQILFAVSDDKQEEKAAESKAEPIARTLIEEATQDLTKAIAATATTVGISSDHRAQLLSAVIPEIERLVFLLHTRAYTQGYKSTKLPPQPHFLD